MCPFHAALNWEFAGSCLSAWLLNLFCLFKKRDIALFLHEVGLHRNRLSSLTYSAFIYLFLNKRTSYSPATDSCTNTDECILCVLGTSAHIGRREGLRNRSGTI